jgi:hypothetical protein
MDGINFYPGQNFKAFECPTPSPPTRTPPFDMQEHFEMKWAITKYRYARCWVMNSPIDGPANFVLDSERLTSVTLPDVLTAMGI